MTDKHLKICSILFAIREMQLKSSIRYHYTLEINNKNIDNCKYCDGCGAIGTLTHFWKFIMVQQLYLILQVHIN